MTEDTLQLIISISKLSVVNGPLTDTRGNEASRKMKARQKNTDTEMGRGDKTARNYMFGQSERFKKHFSLNPANYIFKMIFKD